MTIATLSVDLVAKMARFEADMGKAVRVTQEQSQKMAAAFDFVKGAIVGMAGALSVGAFAAAIKDVAAYADEVGKMAQRVGVGTEALSALQYAASLADVSNEQLGGGLKRLSKIMQEAAGGMQQQRRILKELGVTELQDVNKAFTQLAERFSRMEDGAGKTAAAMTVFGKSGADLIPLLNTGAKGLSDAADEAERFGLIVGKDAVEAAERFNDNLTRLQTLSKGLAITLFGDLVKGIGLATEEFLKGAAAGSKFEGILRAIQTLLTGDDRHKNNVALTEQSEKIKKLADDVVNLRKSGSSLDLALARKKEEQLKVLQRELQTTLSYRKLLDEEEAKPPRTGTVDASIFNSEDPKPVKPPRAPRADKSLDLTNKSIGRYVEGLEAAIRRTRELNTEEEALDFLRREGAGATIDESARLLSLARQVDITKQLQAEQQTLIDLDKTLAEQERASLQATEDRLKGLLDATPTAQLEQSRADMLLLVGAFERGAISEQLYLEAVSARLNLTNEKLEKTKSIAEDLGMTFASAAENAILSFKSLGGVIDGVAKDAARIVVRKTFTEPAANFFTGSLKKLFGGFFADGGDPPLGKVSIVGERGPEWFVPRQAGTIVPAGQMGGGNVTYIFHGGVSRNEVMSGLQAARAGAVGDVVDGQRRRRF